MKHPILRAMKEKWLPSKESKRECEKMVAFYGQFISANDLCFDVGANVGNRIAPFLKLKAKVVAVEPQKYCCKYLKWKFGDKIILIPKGLGEHEAEKTFHIASMSAMSSFSDEWIESVKKTNRWGNIWDKTERIEMTTLDALIKQYGVPKFIKIDVEGYELEVLKGLSQPVNLISFEYTLPEQPKKAIDCIRRIEKINRNTLFNFSTGESMELFLSEWLTAEKMIGYINSADSPMSDFGDIYARST